MNACIISVDFSQYARRYVRQEKKKQDVLSSSSACICAHSLCEHYAKFALSKPTEEEMGVKKWSFSHLSLSKVTGLYTNEKISTLSMVVLVDKKIFLCHIFFMFHFNVVYGLLSCLHKMKGGYAFIWQKMPLPLRFAWTAVGFIPYQGNNVLGDQLYPTRASALRFSYDHGRVRALHTQADQKRLINKVLLCWLPGKKNIPFYY